MTTGPNWFQAQRRTWLATGRGPPMCDAARMSLPLLVVARSSSHSSPRIGQEATNPGASLLCDCFTRNVFVRRLGEMFE
eukprot:6314316-Pyramimonas_sp.AAC.1